MNQFNGAMAQTHAAIRSGVNEAKRYADRGVASAMAMPAAPLLNAGDKWVGAAVGGYGAAQALGVAFAYQPTTALNLSAGVSTAVGGNGGNNIGFRLQAGYRW